MPSDTSVIIAGLAYGIVKPTRILVRPDGYIGLVTESGSSHEIREYMAVFSR